jgi:hypothetical protein
MMMKRYEERPKGSNGVKRFFQRLKVVGRRLVLCIRGNREAAAAIEKKPVMVESIVAKERPEVPAILVATQGPINEKFTPHFTTGFC